MRTYTFDELDNRAQRSAQAKYALGFDVTEEGEETVTLHQSFFGWRFTEHGERIA